MKKEDIRKKFQQEGYHLAYCNGSYFAKKHQQTYKADSLNGLYDILFRNKKYI